MKYERKPNTTCSICQKAVYKRPSDIAKYSNVYCSHECRGIGLRKSHPCPVCGTEVLAQKRANTCSVACSNVLNKTGMTYRTRPRKDAVTTNKSVRQRLVEARGSEQCEACGYDRFPAVIQVHHVVERQHGGSDEVDNLQFLCPTCHYEEHHRRRLAA